MIVFKTAKNLHKYLEGAVPGTQLGFVPTMGALHDGHLSLIRQAQEENDITVVSIFVNPTQFDKEEDLQKYPRELKADLKKLEDAGCNIVYTPEVDDIYPEKTKSETFDYNGLDNYMEGAFRKGHFDGVGTVVKRLLEIVNPDNAYFGEKDYQQLLIIQSMVKNQGLPVKIIGCPIYREPDGLAMSSRNTRLTPAQRKAAPVIYRTLKVAKSLFRTAAVDEVKNFVAEEIAKEKELELEYFEIADAATLKPALKKKKDKKYRGFIAVYAGAVRLIDNIALN